MAHSPDDARRLLCELGDHIRDAVVGARGMDMAVIEGETIADTIYAIDRVADDTLLEWFEEHWTGVEVVSEGLDEPVVVGTDPAWTVIVDTIDGTRGLMYDKRPAWCLAAAAPHGGSLRDTVAAAMTELPTVKQGAADQLSGMRGAGVVVERIDLHEGRRHPLTVRPSSASDLEHGFAGLAKFFVPGKTELAALEAELFDAPGMRARLRRRVHLVGRAAARADHRARPLRCRPAAAGRSVGAGVPSLRRVHRDAPGGGRWRRD